MGHLRTATDIVIFNCKNLTTFIVGYLCMIIYGHLRTTIDNVLFNLKDLIAFIIA